MPILREQIKVPLEPVLRLTTPDDGEPEITQTGDAMSAALGLRISASMYEVWRASDIWHMAGGPERPLAAASRRAGREVKNREFASAVSSAVNEMLGYDGCAATSAGRIRADGADVVSDIVDRLLDRRTGRGLLSKVFAQIERS